LALTAILAAPVAVVEWVIAYLTIPGGLRLREYFGATGATTFLLDNVGVFFEAQLRWEALFDVIPDLLPLTSDSTPPAEEPSI